jgi:hypothetical protein
MDIKATKDIHRRLGQALRISIVSHVDTNGVSLAPSLPDLSGNALSTGQIDVIDNNSRPLASESASNGLTHSTAGTRDRGDTTRQPHQTFPSL